MKAKNKKRYPEPENKNQIERIILAVYLFHALTVVSVVFSLRWNYYALLPLLAGFPLCLWMHLRRYRTYTFRAYFTTWMLWLNLAFYGLFTDDFTGMLTSISAVTILLALYCLPDVFKISGFFYTALIISHLFIIRDLRFTPDTAGVRMIVRLLSVYMIQGIAWCLVKMQQDSNRRLLLNIESLHRAEQSKDDFMANVSHEIRTPVNTICGMSEIVLRSELPDDVRTCMFGIQTAGRNLLSIVSDILDFSELISGKVSILQDSYSITSVINDIINTANARNSEKNLELVVDCDPRMPRLLVGDRQKICRAVINIVDNAIKFTEAGGLVLSMSTRRENYGVNLCISVKDTGIGIRPENLEKIFTSFNQADTRRNRADGGIGLGLAISKAIVNKMGGFLNVKSTYGEGTSVTLIIPQKAADWSPCITVKHPERIRILIYLHMEQFKYPLIREGYKNEIEHMALWFGVSASFCRNLAEVKRRVAGGQATHLFIGYPEYCEDPDWFEHTTGLVQTTMVIERKYQQETIHTSLLCIFAPLYLLSIASVLNGETVHDLSAGTQQNRFTAPDVHILVVDDNLMNLRVVEGLLRPYRLKISVAQSGKEALKLVESRAYDFIFMDHMMPEMDGVETFRRIREKPDDYCRNVPIIALTANAVGNAREMFLAEGFSDYISKPIEMSALEHVLRKFIPKNKMVYAGREITPPKRPVPKPETAPGDSGLSLDGINVSAGMNYCGGNLQDYLDIVRMYYKNGEKNIPEIRKACADGDWKQYVILTHTVKGTSKSIGADALSGLARELEASGRDGRLERIRERTETMLEEYGRVLKTLSENRTVFPDGAPGAPDTAARTPGPSDTTGAASAPPDAAAGAPAPTGISGEMPEDTPDGLSQEKFSDCCKKIAELLENFESDPVLEYIETLKGRSYQGQDLVTLLQPVCGHVRDFDFLGAEDALSELLKGGGIR